MNKQEKTMNRFLKSINMGSEIFKCFLEKASFSQTSVLFNEILEVFKKHKQEVIKSISIETNEIDDTLLKSQQMALIFSRLKIKAIHSEYDLIMESMKALEMGMNKAIDYVHDNNDSLPNHFLEMTKRVIEDYDEILSKIKNYLTNLI